MSKLNKHLYLILLFLFGFTIFVPLVVAWVSSDINYFTNAWDEESYLTMHGLWGRMFELGNFPLMGLFLLSKAGMSGANINLFSDLFFIPITAYFLFQIFKNLNDSDSRFLISSAVIISIFSCLFINCANPLLMSLNVPHRLTLIVSGREPYLSIQRSPNPQISYCLIAIACFFSVRKKLIWPLFIIMPLLYYFTLIPYAFIVCALAPFLSKKVNWSIKNALISSVIFYFLFSIGLIALYQFYIKNSGLILNSGGFETERHFFIPAALFMNLVAILIRALTLRSNLSGMARDKIFVVLVLFAMTSLCATNFQLISGWYFFMKNIQDYAVNPIACVALALAIVSIPSGNIPAKIGVLFFLILNFIWALEASNFDLQIFKFQIYTGRQLKNQDDLDYYLKNPLNTLFTNSDVAGRIAYATGGQIPPFAYQYRFHFIFNQCPIVKESMSRSLEYLKENNSKYLDYFNDADVYIKTNVSAEGKGIPPQTIPLCKKLQLHQEYRIVDDIDDQNWTYWP